MNDDPAEIAAVMGRAIQWAITAAPPGSSDTVVIEVLRRAAERTPTDRESSVVLDILTQDESTARMVIARMQAPEALDRFPLALGRHVWSQRNQMWVPCRALDRVVEVTWLELVRGLTRPRRIDGEKLQAPWWLPVVMRVDAPLLRLDTHIAGVWALVCDLDSGRPVYECIEAVRQTRFKAIIHTTWSHSADHHKARIVVPFASVCPVEQWREVWASGSEWARRLGLEVDPKCKNPSRLYFLPALPAARWKQGMGLFVGQVLNGDPMDWRWLLNECPRPAEASGAPTGEARPRVHLGLPPAALDAEARRRRAFAEGVVRHRAQGLVAQGEGGRNQTLYTAGRAACQLALSGTLDLEWARAELQAAAAAAGLKAGEADRAIENGINKGQQDGPWQF